MTNKIEKSKILMLKCWMFYFEAEGLSCSLYRYVLYGGLGISKLQFFYQKIQKSFPAVNFSIFSHQNLDPELDLD
jgi:hypothetical protein